ncbi:unnamed protein product [Heligmosomoides polygyrus]|uniref:MULE domain-containing protein n=1 Tax=Heligmosomoides polygyrus TaxID=6339 RepID=A0A183FX57_HELPZ|nr:unnamed protein product [Heligmosomoides polygyrus]
MSSDINATVLLEGDIVHLSTGPHRLVRLTDGSLCAVPLQLSEEQLLYVCQLDAAALLAHRSESDVAPNEVFDGVSLVETPHFIEDADDGHGTGETVSAADDEEVYEDEDDIPGTSGLQEDGAGSGRDDGRYLGIMEPSKYGRHPVLIYKIPGRQLCYTFTLHKTNQCSKTYRCTGCVKQANTRTSVRVVREIEFERDPCALPHVCLPSRWLNEKSRRTFYGKCHEWRSDERYADLSANVEHGKFLLEVNRAPNLTTEEKEATLSDFHRFRKVRSTISRNMGCGNRDRAVTMESVPDSLALSADGTRFLHYHTPDMHIYYSESIIRRACENGLDTLIADGIFGMHPRDRNGQLYTIHGVCNGKVDVPLLFAITDRKSESVYTMIWSTLCDVLEAAMGRQDLGLHVVVDFERASIKAIRRIMPGSSVEGCLRSALGAKQPSLRTLLEHLHALNAKSLGKLVHYEQYPAADVSLRPRDIRRREKVRGEMERFRLRLLEQDEEVTTREITRYCRRMARFVSEKSNL